LRKLRRIRPLEFLPGVTKASVVQRTEKTGGADESQGIAHYGDGTGSDAGHGAHRCGAGHGVRTAGADSLQDAQLQESLGAEFFRVDWSAKPDGHGKTRITGYVYSDKGRAADEVQLHISELDASGKQVGSYFERMLESVPAEGRGYFDVKVPVNAQAASYHVAVYSWNDVEGGTK